MSEDRQIFGPSTVVIVNKALEIKNAVVTEEVVADPSFDIPEKAIWNPNRKARRAALAHARRAARR